MNDATVILKDMYIQIWHVSQPARHVGDFGATECTTVLSRFYGGKYNFKIKSVANQGSDQNLNFHQHARRMYY
jgi:hypothetical protein